MKSLDSSARRRVNIHAAALPTRRRLISAMLPAASASVLSAAVKALHSGIITSEVETNVALCCCRMNMPSAGRAKFADCNVHENKKVISKQPSKLCVPKLRRAAQGTVNCSRMTTKRSCSNECSCSAQRERAARHERARDRSLRMGFSL